MKHKLLFILSVCGVAFSGYLSGIKLFSGTCAFNETCPLFLGYPTCYYGFVMFFVMFLFLGLSIAGYMTKEGAVRSVIVVSLLGLIFSGYFTFRELPKIIDEGIRAYMLGLPTCAYGFVVYLLMFGVGLSLQRKN